MGFKYVEYDTLSKYIRESIATELKVTIWMRKIYQRL